MKIIQNTIILLLLVIFQHSYSQKKDENIGTEVVNVVKAYSTTISDAFKVKDTPSLEDDENTKKEDIKYNIFSFPVASTFTPSKGKAAGVDKSKKERLFSNYASLGVGNYGTILGELYLTENLNSNQYVGGILRHHSSQGGIKDLVLNDKFYDTSIDLTYGSQTKASSWNLDLGYKNQMYNWYGINQDYFATVPNIYNSIDPKHNFNTLYLGGNLGLEKGFFKTANVKYTRFWDNNNSLENRLVIKPNLSFNAFDTTIKTNFIIDHLSGSFKKDYSDTSEIKYGYTNVGFNPSFLFAKDDLSINAGAIILYSSDTENNLSKFHVYPQVNLSYKLVGDLMVFSSGIEGNLEQNSYQEFAAENLFVSPTLNIMQTDKVYDFYAGLKGKLAGNVSYNVKGGIKNEKNATLFKSNAAPDVANLSLNQLAGFRYGNSFNVAYDDIKTVVFSAELKADLSKDVSFGILGEFNSYNTKIEAEAWNLPAVKINSTLDFNITSKWYAGTNVFYVGDRKAVESSITGQIGSFDTVILKSYFDINAHVGFKYNEKFTAFLRGNNLANQAYQKWVNFPSQQLQIVVGANYKFDF